VISPTMLVISSNQILTVILTVISHTGDIDRDIPVSGISLNLGDIPVQGYMAISPI